MKLYYLGPKGTYSETCAKKILKIINKDFEPIAVSTIFKTIDIINQDENSVAVLPIENMIQGIVRQTIDRIYETEVKIQLQTEIKIEHCLVSKGDKAKIKHIISHQQALAQSQKYILENFGNDIDLLNSSSTAAALDFISDKDETYGAICAFDFAKQTDYNILDKDIGDVKDNATRFVVLSRKNLQLMKPTRTSIVFNTKNKPGALLKILKIFEKHELNLVYLESRPSKRAFGEYNFFLDIDKGLDYAQDALLEVEKECNYYKMLGSYGII